MMVFFGNGYVTAPTFVTTSGTGGTLPYWVDTTCANATNVFTTTNIFTTTGASCMGFTNQTTSLTQQNMLVMMAMQQYVQQAQLQGQCEEYQVQARRLPSPEEMAAAEARHLERRREVEERAQQERVEREASAAKARELLLSHLTPEQRRTFERNKWFVVEGGVTKKRYRIDASGGVAGNVRELNARGDVVHTYCAHLGDRLIPPDDHYLTQKLMLEYDEQEFLRVANRS